MRNGGDSRIELPPEHTRNSYEPLLDPRPGSKPTLARSGKQDVGKVRILLARSLDNVQKAVGFEHKVRMILIPGSMIGIWIQNQFCVRKVLYQVERIDRVHDHVVISAHDQSRLLDVLEISKPFTRVRTHCHGRRRCEDR